ncbi:hypothetical protein HWV62_16928 [Athelia sp. TMB]|nr:hypothetical protein HWV62_16928 [Athelia sp. TMB]
MRCSLFTSLVSLATIAASVMSASVPAAWEAALNKRDEPKYVFAHFIVGIVASYTQADWTADMQLAQATGIDGFALNIGTDSYNPTQLGYAYAAAEALGFKVFLSFDFSYWNASSTADIAGYISTYGALPAQFMYNGDVFVSTFNGDGVVDWAAVAAQSQALFACPNWQAASFAGASGLSCGFNWNGNMTTAGDEYYLQELGSLAYMMRTLSPKALRLTSNAAHTAVSPWFSTHYGPASYNKNWIFYSDWLFQPRWEQVLQLAPAFVEIVTWNDFGESHYIGPLHPDDPEVYAGGATGAVQWVTGMPHDAWRDVAAPYIAAYKAGAAAPTVTTEELVYYYRPTPKGATCTDAVPQPTGYEDDDDLVFVIAMTTSDATVEITSGSNAVVSIDVPAGITTVSAPMAVGSQTFALTRGGATVMTGTGGLQVSDSCTVYNFNAYTGTVTA